MGTLQPLTDHEGNPRPAQYVIDEAAEQLGILPKSIVDRVRESDYLWSDALTKAAHLPGEAPPDDHPWRQSFIPLEGKDDKWSYTILTRDTRRVLYSAYELSFISKWLHDNGIRISTGLLQTAIHSPGLKTNTAIVIGPYSLEKVKVENKNEK